MVATKGMGKEWQRWKSSNRVKWCIKIKTAQRKALWWLVITEM